MTRPKLLRFFTFTLILLNSFVNCSVIFPTSTSPQYLYIFDASAMHVNHFEDCKVKPEDKRKRCSIDGPLPMGKTFPGLLRDYDTLMFLATLQGIVNRDQPRLYLNQDHARNNKPSMDMFWLEKYQTVNQPYGWLVNTKIITLTNLEEVLTTFSPSLRGVVVWDNAVPATLNVATTIAGVEDLAILRDGSEITPQILNHLQVKKSLVGMFQPNAKTLPDSSTPSSGSTKVDAYLWAIENYLAAGKTNPTVLSYIEDGWPAIRYTQKQMTRGGVYAFERDYTVQQRSFAFDLNPWADELPIDDPQQTLGLDRHTLEQIIQTASQQANGNLIKIWGFHPWWEKYAGPPAGGDPNSKYQAIPGEWEYLWLFAQYGGYMEGGGGDVNGLSMSNISIHDFAPRPLPRPAPPAPTEASLKELGYLTPEGKVSADHTFLTFYVGDYDIVHPTQLLLGNYSVSPWLDEKRGKIPLAWGLNPGMVEEIPGIMSYLYATTTDQDYIVGTNSGAGYINPDGPDKLTFLRWLWRSEKYYSLYGYDIMGFIINGNGAQMSQSRLDAFAYLTPVGMLSIDIQTDDPWPRWQNGVPLSTIPILAFGGTPDSSAELVHQIYRRDVLKQGRPPFMVFRSTFLSTTFLWEIRERLKAHEAENHVTNNEGQVIHPNYTVIDPYTYFFLLRRWLETNSP